MQKGIGLVCSFDTCQGAARFKSLISYKPKTAPRLSAHRGCRLPLAGKASISNVVKNENYCFSSREASERVKRCQAKVPNV